MEGARIWQGSSTATGENPNRVRKGLGGVAQLPLPAALTLKWPVLAKIWYLPWLVMREP